VTTHVALLEALLFASGKPATVERLAEAAEITREEVETALDALEKACEAEGRGVRVDRVAGGARLVSRNEFDLPVRSLLGLEGKNKLSIASLEVLSIVAYRQPVTAPEIADLRGVNSASSLRTLLDKKLITTAGRKEVVGTPFLYKTTKEFLVHFGLADLKDLPRPEDLDALYGVETNTAQTELFPEQNAEEKMEEIEEEKKEEDS
jgi:segregation and condensation protein B